MALIRGRQSADQRTDQRPSGTWPRCGNWPTSPGEHRAMSRWSPSGQHRLACGLGRRPSLRLNRNRSSSDYAAALDRLRVTRGCACRGGQPLPAGRGCRPCSTWPSWKTDEAPASGPARTLQGPHGPGALGRSARRASGRRLCAEGGDHPPVYFFYLNTQPPDAPQPLEAEAEPARIEVPEWVALSREKLDLGARAGV